MRLDFSFFFFVDRRSIEIINCEIIVRIINRKEEKFKENWKSNNFHFFFFYRHIITKNFEYFILVSKRDRLFSLIIPRSRGKYRVQSFPTVCNTLRRNDSTRYRSFIKLYVDCRVHSATERDILISPRRPFHHRWRRWSRRPVSSARVPWTDQSQRFTGNSPFSCFLPAKGIEETCRPTICSAIFSFIKPSIFELTGLRHPIRLFLSVRSWAITFNRR